VAPRALDCPAGRPRRRLDVCGRRSVPVRPSAASRLLSSVPARSLPALPAWSGRGRGHAWETRSSPGSQAPGPPRQSQDQNQNQNQVFLFCGRAPPGMGKPPFPVSGRVFLKTLEMDSFAGGREIGWAQLRLRKTVAGEDSETGATTHWLCQWGQVAPLCPQYADQ
jgi:hypothetical protein